MFAPPWGLLPVQENLMLVGPSEGWIDGAGLIVARPGTSVAAVPDPPAAEPLAPPVASSAVAVAASEAAAPAWGGPYAHV